MLELYLRCDFKEALSPLEPMRWFIKNRGKITPKMIMLAVHRSRLDILDLLWANRPIGMLAQVVFDEFLGDRNLLYPDKHIRRVIRWMLEKGAVWSNSQIAPEFVVVLRNRFNQHYVQKFIYEFKMPVSPPIWDAPEH